MLFFASMNASLPKCFKGNHKFKDFEFALIASYSLSIKSISLSFFATFNAKSFHLSDKIVSCIVDVGQ